LRKAEITFYNTLNINNEFRGGGREVNPGRGEQFFLNGLNLKGYKWVGSRLKIRNEQRKIIE